MLLGPVASVDAACREFVVVGEDASYLLLDGETWEVYRVGSYWSEGVREVSAVLANSTDRRPAFATNEFVSVYDREPMIAAPVPDNGGPNAVVVLRMAAYAQRMGSPPPYGRLLEFLWPPYYYVLEGFENAHSNQWAHWLREDTLFRAFDVGDATAVYHLTGNFESEEELDSGELEVLNVWDIGSMDLTMPFCAVGDTLYFTDAANALSVPAAGGPSIERRPHLALAEGDYELTPLHTKNCKALANRPPEDDTAQLEYALYDITADTIESKFGSTAPARSMLFAGGSLWLQQLAQDSDTQDQAGEEPTARDSIITDDSAVGQDFAEEPVPSSVFRLVNTATGEVLGEAELDIPGGALIEEMQCDADTPRAVIAGPRRIWLLDAESLAIVATAEIPFERDYFVFE